MKRLLEAPLPFGIDRRTWLWFAAAVAAAIGLLVLVDRPISAAATSLPDSVRGFFFWITDFGLSDWVLIPAVLLFSVSALLGLLIRKPTPRRALWQMAQLYGFIFLGVGLPGLFANIVKRIVGRGRPELYDSVGIWDPRYLFNDYTYQSFVSGHTTTIFAVAFVTGFLSPRLFPWALLLAVLVGLSRIIVGAHYPSDVLGGVVVGTLGAYAIRNVFAARRWVFERRPDGSIGLRSFAAVRRLLRSKR